jgi:hypothetical protein
MKRAGGKAGFTGSRMARLRLLASPCHQQRVHTWSVISAVCTSAKPAAANRLL